MVKADFPKPSQGEKDEYRLQKLHELGACGLGIAKAAKEVWIRKVFLLSRLDNGSLPETHVD
jgi:hypothetical protein